MPRPTVTQRLERDAKATRSAAERARWSSLSLLFVADRSRLPRTGPTILKGGTSPLCRAFDKFGLDSWDQAHHPLLLQKLAEVFFERADGGAKKRWNERAQRQLMIVWAKHEAALTLFSKRTQMQIAAAVIAAEPAYAGMEPGALVRQFCNARRRLSRK